MRGLAGHLWPRVPAIDPAAGSDGTVARHAGLATVGIIVQGLVRFVYSVVIGNVAGRAILGAVNAGISLALFASLLVPSATAMAATKHVARARGAGDLAEVDRVTSYLSRLTLWAMVGLGAGSALVAAPLLGLSVLEAVLTGVLAVTYSGYVYVRGFLFGAGQVVRATVWDVASSAAAIIGLALVLLADAPAWLLLPLGAGYGLYAAASWPRHRAGSTPLAPSLRAEIRGFLWLTLVNSVATGGFLQLSMVGAQYWDRVEAGSFAAALSLATPASLVSRSLTLALFPSLSAARGRGDHVSARRQTDRATRGLVLISLVTFGPLMLVSPFVVDLLYRDPEFARAALLLPVLLGAVMVTNIAAGAINALLSGEHRHSRIVVVASVVGALTGVAWWFLRAPQDGVAGVAVGFLVGSAVVGLVPVAAQWRLGGHQWAEPAAKLAAGAGLLLAGVWWEQSVQPSVYVQLGLAAGFVLLCLAASRREVADLMRAVRR